MFIKRLFDIPASLFSHLLLWPVLLEIALLIKIKMPGPVLFTQKRVGQHGKLFTLIKFRSMSVNHNGSSISVKGECRITQPGAKLCKYKPDELPELCNVLKGEMSFAGPLSREIFILFQQGCPDVPGIADKLSGE